MYKRRAVFAITALLALPVIIFLVYINRDANRESAKAAEEYYVREYVDKLNTRNADIIFYKHDPVVPDGLKARRVNTLDYSFIEDPANGNFSYHVIVLYDLDDSLELSLSEYNELNSLISGRNYRFIYLDTKMYPQLAGNNIISGIPDEGTKSYFTFYKDKSCHVFEGFADDPTMVPPDVSRDLSEDEVIVYSAVFELATKDLYWS